LERFFHCCAADADPQRLLDPDRQLTEPWGSHDHGPCDKCSGKGVVLYECRSCLEAGALPDCPACQGRVRFREICPACLGDAHTGALLVHPERIVEVRPLDVELVEAIRARPELGARPD